MVSQVGSQIVSGSAVRFEGCGILLIGQSGTGKSDLCLRIIDAGGKLVVDDQAQIKRDESRLLAYCPPQLQGLLEVRGVGIMRFPSLPLVKLDFVIQLQGEPERLPDEQYWSMFGIALPLYKLCAKHTSAIAVLRQLCGLTHQEIKLLPNDQVLKNVAA